LLTAAVGVAAVLGACCAVFVALVTNAIVSTDEAQSHESTLLVVQLVVAIVGLVPTGLFARALYRRDPAAPLWFVVGIVTYALWGVLNDAAVHGWSHSVVF
jgi:hypothetical protein